MSFHSLHNSTISIDIMSRSALAGVMILSLLLSLLFSTTVLAEEEKSILPTVEEETVIETSVPEPELEPKPELTTVDEGTGEPEDTSGDIIIDTGDAIASGTLENEVNTNEIITTETPLEPVTEEENVTSTETLLQDEEVASSTPELTVISEEDDEDIDDTTGTSTLIVLNENEADILNDADIGAQTGSNTVNNNNNNTLINTGNSMASANVLNVVNTNIFDSTGFFLFLSNLFGFSGDLDVRDYDFFTPIEESTTKNARESVSGGNNPCSVCNASGEVTVVNENKATITNDIVVRSTTGSNESTDNLGNSIIKTGDAYSVANVINVVNTNIIDSNYLLLTLNNFGDWGGDVVFPAADIFASLFGGQGGGVGGGTTVQNTNKASITNTISTSASTGSNTAESNGGLAVIETGDARSHTNVINQVNTNLLNTDSFTVLFRIHGEWTGDIFGIPEGVTWQETEGGLQLSFDPHNSFSDLTASLYPNVTNTNVANITNNIKVLALTGDNKVENTGDGTAVISTGNAYAATNIINVANTNIVGKNWMLAIINIFGDWGGNISFGRPNLWIGGQVNLYNSTPGPWAPLTYDFTVLNYGDVPATDVTIRLNYDHSQQEFTTFNQHGDTRLSSDEILLNIGDIPAGESRKVQYHAQVDGNIPLGKSFITTTAYTSSAETEDDYEDNTEIITFDVWRENISYSYGTKVNYTSSPNLRITKTNSADGAIMASSTVDYTIVIENIGGGPAYNAVLIDTLKNENDEIIYEEYWDLGKIYRGEEIEVTYTTFFNEATNSGVYTNYAQVRALAGHETFIYGHNGDSPVVTSSIEVIALPEALGTVAEVVEVVEGSVEIEEISVMEENEEVANASQKAHIVLAPLYSHPIFTQHPVNLILPPITLPSLATQLLHPAQVSLYSHPVFTQHPIFVEHTAFELLTKRNTTNIGLLHLLAGSAFVDMLKWPFDTLAAIPVARADSIPIDEDGFFILLALSIFFVRKQTGKKK